MRITLTGSVIIGLISLLSIAVFGESVSAEMEIKSIFGPDLLAGGGNFENWSTDGQPGGWKVETEKGTCESDVTSALGSKSLKLHVPGSPGKVRLLSLPIKVKPEMQYFIRFAFRVEGISDKDRTHVNGQAKVDVLWLNESNQVYRMDLVGYSCFPIQWCYRNTVVRSVSGASFMQISVEMDIQLNEDKVYSTVWFDDVFICEYNAPIGIGENVVSEWSPVASQHILKTPGSVSWFYLAGKEGREYAFVKREKDSNALSGYALHCKLGSPNPFDAYESPTSIEQTSGLYRVFVRIKAPLESKVNQGAGFLHFLLSSNDSNTWVGRMLTLSDFKTRGQYEDIALDFIKRSSGWINFRIQVPGGETEFWLDHIRYVQLRPFTDTEILTLFPGLSKFSLESSSTQKGLDVKFLVVEGLCADKYRISEAIEGIPNAETTKIFYNNNILGHEGGSIGKFPAEMSELRKYDVVVLANAGLGSLGPDGRLRLREFVRMGGGILMLGGKSAYGNAGIRGSMLEDVLPVKVAETRFDIEPGGTLEITQDRLVSDITLPNGIVSTYLHNLKVRENASVVIRLGQKPFLVTGGFEKGRVACITGTPYGTASEGKILFTEWKDWHILLKNILVWLLQTEERRM